MRLILIVDDASFMRRAVNEIVTRNYPDVYIEHFDNGRSLLDYYKEIHEQNKKVDAIILDHTMPVMSGFEACQKLLEFDPKAPIIAFTGEIEPYIRFFEMGIKNHIHKPVIEQQAIETLNRYLE